MHIYFKKIGTAKNISLWEFYHEVVKPPPTSNNSLNPLLCYVGAKAIVKFNGSCLKQDKITFTHGTVVICLLMFHEET